MVVVEFINLTGSASKINANVRVGTSSPPGVDGIQDRVRIEIQDTEVVSLQAFVPDGSYYRIASFAQESIDNWRELEYST